MTTTTVCAGKCLTFVEQASHSSIGGAIVISVALICLTVGVIALAKTLFD